MSVSRYGDLAGLMLGVLKKVRLHATDESGVAAVLIASVIAVLAFSALSVFLNRYIGDRTFERAKSTTARQSIMLPAVLTYFNQQSTLVCPDLDRDGISSDDTTGDTCNGKSGTLPWTDLGLTQDDVIDGYGNYYTYVASTVAREMCLAIGNDYDSDEDPTQTGSPIDATDLEILETSQSAGAGRYVPFVVFSHGKNGYGATTRNGGEIAFPDTSPPARETNNAGASPTVIYTGPHATTGTDALDDQVFAPTAAQITKTCTDLTPGSALNADIGENFDGGPPEAADDADSDGFDDAKFVTPGGGNSPTRVRDANNNGKASFPNNLSYLASAGSYNPSIRPVYVTALWTPSPTLSTATNSGFSIATRATLSGLSGDDFTTRGITFRFDDRDGSTSSSVGVQNTLSIRNDGAPLAVTSVTGTDLTYNLINGQNYLLEVWDNGLNVWMRITQVSDRNNTATAIATTTFPTDMDGDQRAVLINSAAVSYVDDFYVGFPTLALETGPTAGYVETGTAINGTTTGTITLEAWIRPKSLPTTGAVANVMAQWDTTQANGNSFRLYLDGDNDGQLTFAMDDSTGAVEVFDLGYKPDLDAWTHIAVTHDASSHAIRFYQDGALTTSATSVRSIQANGRRFTVGASLNGGGIFDGYISDVRVWSDVRSAVEIRTYFQQRLSVSGSEAGLVVNWKFDSESGTAGGTQDVIAAPAAAARDGEFQTGAKYVPSLAYYFRPFSTEICPDPDGGGAIQGGRVGPYQCDLRYPNQSNDLTVPARLPYIYGKVWGAGGGGHIGSGNLGGGGGFVGGLIANDGSLLGVDIGTGMGPGDDGEDSEIRSGSDDMLTGGGGSNASAGNDGNGGNGQTDSEVIYPDDPENADAPEPGCSTTSDPCTDPYYAPAYLDPALEEAGRGGEVSTSHVGRNGAVILLW
jgi:hypothetical protein